MKVKLYDNNGHEKNVEQDILETDNMEISRMTFSGAIDNNFNFTEKPNATFKKGETVFVYAELQDLPQEYVNGKYHYKIAVDMGVYDTEGRLITSISKENLTIKEESGSTPFSIFRLKNDIIPSLDAPLGEYSVKFIFRDLLTGKIAVKTAYFYLG